MEGTEALEKLTLLFPCRFVSSGDLEPTLPLQKYPLMHRGPSTSAGGAALGAHLWRGPPLPHPHPHPRLLLAVWITAPVSTATATEPRTLGLKDAGCLGSTRETKLSV